MKYCKKRKEKGKERERKRNKENTKGRGKSGVALEILHKKQCGRVSTVVIEKLSLLDHEKDGWSQRYL